MSICPNCGHDSESVLPADTVVSWGGWTLNLSTRIVNETGPRLQPQQARILELLLRAEGRVISIAQINDGLYLSRYKPADTDNTTRVQISRIRRMLPSMNLIVTYKAGYQLKEHATP